MKKWEIDRKRVLEIYPNATMYANPRCADTYVAVTSNCPNSSSCLAFHNSWNDMNDYEEYKTLIWSEAWHNIQMDIMKKLAE